MNLGHAILQSAEICKLTCFGCLDGLCCVWRVDGVNKGGARPVAVVPP